MDLLELTSGGAGQMFLSFSGDDEIADRLNHRYTVALLLLFAALIATKQFSSVNIKCWVPAHLSKKKNKRFYTVIPRFLEPVVQEFF